MSRSTRLLIVFSVFVIAATLFLLAIPSAAQTATATPSDWQLTTTRIFAGETQTQAFRPTQYAIATETIQSIEATRTAIAVTREPYLLTPQTPNPMELTATRIMSNDLFTLTAYKIPSETPEVYPIALTATWIVGRATQTAFALTQNPALALTENPTLTATPSPTATPVSCAMRLTSSDQSDLEDRLVRTLVVGHEVVSVFTRGVGNRCGEFYPLRTVFGFRFNDIYSSTHDALLARITHIIEILYRDFPADPSYGEEIRINIFMGNRYFHSYIETGYANALAAYGEGLRGDALMEALGGLWHDDRGYYMFNTAFP